MTTLTGQAYAPYTQTPLQYAGAPPAATRAAIVRYLRYMDFVTADKRSLRSLTADSRSRAVLWAVSQQSAVSSQQSLFEPEPNLLEMRLVVEHCADVINSPWLVFPPELVAQLRSSIEHVKLPHELANWLWGAAQIGVEPL